MSNIIDRQTFVISVNLNTLTLLNVPPLQSIVTLPMNLRFSADELVLKNITYNAVEGNDHLEDAIQIYCNITNDNLIGVFPNTVSNSYYHDEHFRISNSFQNGNFVLEFQGTDGTINDALPNPPGLLIGPVASYLPQRLISSQNPQLTTGVVNLTIEFLKLRDKTIF